MRLLKKTCAMLLLLALLFSLAACAGTDTTTTATNGTTTEKLDETSGSPDVTEDPVPLTLFVDETWWPYDTWEGAIPEEFNRKAGVEIEVTRAADENQLGLMVASGDMTDLICTWRFQYLANEEKAYPINELQETYPDVDFPVHSVHEFVNTMSDGNFYTIGVGFSPESAYQEYDHVLSEGPGFMVREDILNELGLEINSLEDIDTVFAAVNEAYPEMITAAFNHIHRFGWLRNMMGVPTGSYFDDNGELIWYIRHEGQLEYYKKVNEWYRNGYLSSENFAFQTEDETAELVISGRAFANFGYDNHADNFNTSIAANGDDYRVKLITDIISNSAVKYENFAGGRGVYVTKSADNVEAAYRAMAYAYGDEGMKLLIWGIEDEDYSLNADGYPEFNYDYQGDNSVLQPRGLKYWGWLTHNAIVTGIAEVTAESQTADARRSAGSIVKRNPAIALIRFEIDSEESIISSRLDDMISNEQINIYMADSEAECEAAYYDMIALAEEIGMSDLEAYGNSKYKDLGVAYNEIKNNLE